MYKCVKLLKFLLKESAANSQNAPINFKNSNFNKDLCFIANQNRDYKNKDIYYNFTGSFQSP